jgi:hypothetical protein
MANRKLVSVLPAPQPHWVGDGFHVFPLFADLAFGQAVSPFLMLDYAAPHEFRPSAKPPGVGAHPHRGFETVTIVYDGEIEHRDSAGNNGTIGPGDVQWMTAGSGILHQEMPKGNAKGQMHGFQLWANLPSVLLALATNIVLNWLWIPRWSGAGAAWATLVSYTVAWVFTSFLLPGVRPVAALKIRSLFQLPHLIIELFGRARSQCFPAKAQSDSLPPL